MWLYFFSFSFDIISMYFFDFFFPGRSVVFFVQGNLQELQVSETDKKEKLNNEDIILLLCFFETNFVQI